MKILIVDDAPDTCAWLRALLEKGGWDVEEATDGLAACRLLKSEIFRIVITDWMMPGMDGLNLIEWIRARKSNNYIYTIMMTGRDGQEDCVRGLSVGADDYLTKPVAATILNARLSVAVRILNMEGDLRAQEARLRESRDLIAHAFTQVQDDIENAADVQQSQLLVNGLSSRSISAAWCCRPSMGVSGDHFDVFRICAERLAFYLLDVSGHGVTAALRCSAISQLLKPITGLVSGMCETDPGQVLEQLNRQICEGNEDLDYFATLIVGDIDPDRGILRWSSAGHPSPLLLRQGFGAVEIMDKCNGIPLGIDKNSSYGYQETQLQTADSIILFSDGLLDCENADGQRFGLDRVRQSVENYGLLQQPELLEQIEEKIDTWCAGEPLGDDLSILLLRYDTDIQGTLDKKEEYQYAG